MLSYLLGGRIGDFLAPRPRQSQEIWSFLHAGLFDKALAQLRKQNHEFDINSQDLKNGMTILHYCSAAGHLECLVEVLSQGAVCKIQDCLGNTALHLAAMNEQKGAVEVLLRSGADPSIPNHEGVLPLEQTGDRQVRELFLRDRSSIFSPMVQVKALVAEILSTNNNNYDHTAGSRSLEGGNGHNSTDSMKIALNDIMGEDDVATAGNSHNQENDGKAQEEYTVVGVSSAQKPSRHSSNSGGHYISSLEEDHLLAAQQQQQLSHLPIYHHHQTHHSNSGIQQQLQQQYDTDVSGGASSPLQQQPSHHRQLFTPDKLQPPPPTTTTTTGHATTGNAATLAENSRGGVYTTPLVPPPTAMRPNSMLNTSAMSASASAAAAGNSYYYSYYSAAATPYSIAATPYAAAAAATMATPSYGGGYSSSLNLSPRTASMQPQQPLPYQHALPAQIALEQQLPYEVLQASLETSHAFNLPIEEFEVRRKFIRALQTNSLEAAKTMIMLDPTLPKQHLAQLGNIATDGQTALHILAACPNTKPEQQQQAIELLQLCQEAGLSFYKRDTQGRTPIHIAGLAGNELVCLYLRKAMMEERPDLGDPIGYNAPVDLAGLTPLGVAKTKRKPLKPSLKEVLFSPGDRSILPLFGSPLPTVAGSVAATAGRLGTPYYAAAGSASQQATPMHYSAYQQQLQPPYSPSSSSQHTPMHYSAYQQQLQPPYSPSSSSQHSGSLPYLSNHSQPTPGSIIKQPQPLATAFPASSTAGLIMYGASEASGWTTGMEDRMVIASPLLHSNPSYQQQLAWSLFSVIDGHGGSYVSELIRKELTSVLLQAIDKQLGQLTAATPAVALGGSPTAVAAAAASANAAVTTGSNGLPYPSSANGRRRPSYTAASMPELAPATLPPSTSPWAVLENPTSLTAILVKTCLAMDEFLAKQGRLKVTHHPKTGMLTMLDSSGAAAVIALVTKSYLAVGNVGDCRAILARWQKQPSSTDSSRSNLASTNSSSFVTAPTETKLPRMEVLPLTRDHKMSVMGTSERERVLAAGGKVNLVQGQEMAGYEQPAIPSAVGEEAVLDAVKQPSSADSASRSIHEVYTPFYSGRLRMTRALGDFYLKANQGLPMDQQAVIAVPEVIIYTLTALMAANNDDCFLVLACDGIWDVLSNSEVVEMVATFLGYDSAADNQQPISQALVNEACDVVIKVAFNRGSGDNMSVMIVIFSLPPSFASSAQQAAIAGATNSSHDQNGSSSYYRAISPILPSSSSVNATLATPIIGNSSSNGSTSRSKQQRNTPRTSFTLDPNSEIDIHTGTIVPKVMQSQSQSSQDQLSSNSAMLPARGGGAAAVAPIMSTPQRRGSSLRGIFEDMSSGEGEGMERRGGLEEDEDNAYMSPLNTAIHSSNRKMTGAYHDSSTYK